GNDQGKNLNQLSSPDEIIVDSLGQIYIVDWGNTRVMRWCEGKEEGEIRSNQLKYPRGLSFDDEGNLYVADWGNNQIAKFVIIL
ncbi:unnamed protein product, partial [Adineta steineri]